MSVLLLKIANTALKKYHRKTVTAKLLQAKRSDSASREWLRCDACDNAGCAQPELAHARSRGEHAQLAGAGLLGGLRG